MTDEKSAVSLTPTQLFSLFVRILGPERNFYVLTGIYGVGISLLTLALQISVQMLINTVANTGLIAPLAVLSITLFALLVFSGLLNALRIHLMEIFGRRFYARMTSEIALRSIYANNPYFLDASKGPLFNRYFDVVIVQKSVPNLLIGGFTIVLQAVVGFILVSLYHPLFLVFNIVFLALIWAIWAIWGPGAISAAIELSHEKHKTAAWLEGLAASNGFFKSERHVEYALKRTDEETAGYVDQHRRHFRKFFSQTIAFLMIYAAASATLLGMGGWLVIQGQLTLGQLVAAELILSAVFVGVSQFGYYLTLFYDLCAAVEELSLFYDVDQEEPVGAPPVPLLDATLEFIDVRGDARGKDANLNFTIPGGAKIMAAASDHGLQRLMAQLLRRHQKPAGGFITFGGGDIVATEVQALRQQIVMVNRPMMIEMTIREYLRLNCANASPLDIMNMLKTVGLEDAIAALPDGLDTKLASTGWPLSVTEVMQLKLAGAILAKPQVIVINQLIDLLPEERLRKVISALHENRNQTIIYFSNRAADLGFDQFLFLEHDRQRLFSDFDEFDAARNGRYRGGGEPPARLIHENPAGLIGSD